MASQGSLRHPYRSISPDRRRLLTDRLLSRANENESERDALIEEVVLLNVEVAHSIASRHRDRGIPLEDLEQVACAALVRVARRYDATTEHDFLAYAAPSIRGEVRRHFRDHGWTVRPPRRLQELRPRILAEEDRQRAAGQEASVETIGEALAVPVGEVREALDVASCFTPVSLDLRVALDDPAMSEPD